MHMFVNFLAMEKNSVGLKPVGFEARKHSYKAIEGHANGQMQLFISLFPNYITASS